MALDTELVRSLDQLWAEARSDFWEKTKPNSVDIGRQSGVMADDLMRKMEAEYAPPDDTSKKQAIRVVDDVLKLVQLMGGIAAHAASTIFSPAGMCFNAISFLLDGIKGMRRFHSDLASLFGSIKSFLVHFKMLQRVEGKFMEIDLQQMPSELIMTTNKLMKSFVQLCLLAHKAIARGKFKTAMVDLRVAFIDDDGGVRKELAKFKSLIQDQDSIKGTITLEQVMETRSDIRDVLIKVTEESIRTARIDDNITDIKKDLTTRKDKEQENERLQRIAVKLGIASSKDSKDARDAPPLWKDQLDRLEDIRKKRLDQSGDWLLKQKAYNEWRSLNTTAYPVLCLVGRKDTGKTYTSYKVISDWLDTGESRSATAYYFFTDPGSREDAVGKTAPADGPKMISEALRTMAYMLARSNPKYALELDTSADLPRETFKNLPPNRVLEILRLASVRSTPFVLIFDGLDQVPTSEAFIRYLSRLDKYAPRSPLDEKGEKDAQFAQSRQHHPRFLLTISPDETDFNQIAPDVSAIHFYTAAGAPAAESDGRRNIEDLERFIEERVGSAGSELAPQAKDKPRLFADFKERLLEISDGRFSIVSNRIGFVAQSIANGLKSEQELENVMMSRETDDLNVLAKQIIDNLERTLSAIDITQINDILAWVMYAPGPDFTPALLDAVAAFNKESATIQKFSQKLEDRRLYRKLFNLEQDDGITRVGIYDHIYDWLVENPLRNTGSESAVQDTSRPKISMTITIQHAEPKAVRRFLWDLHEKLTFDKSFFSISGSQIESKGRIGVNDLDAMSSIMHQSLDLLLDEPQEETNALRLWAFKFFPTQIWRIHGRVRYDAISEQSFIVPELNSLISKLATFLSGEDIADLIRQAAEDGWDATTWIQDRANVRALDDLLDESRVPSLTPQQKRALRSVHKGISGEGAPLYKAVCQAGHAWLLGGEGWSAEKDGWLTPFSMAWRWVEEWLSLRNEWEEWQQSKPNSDEIDGLEAHNSQDSSTKLQNLPSDNSKSSLEAHMEGAGSPALNDKEMPSVQSPEASEPTLADGQTSESAPLPPSPPPLELNTEPEARAGAAFVPPPLPSPPPSVQEDFVSPVYQEMPPLGSRIRQAANWVHTHCQIAKRNEAIATFKEALQVTENPARVHRQLSRVYRFTDEFDQALVEARAGLDMCEGIGDETERKKEIRELKRVLADTHSKRKTPHEALSVYDEVLAADQRDYQTYHDMLDMIYYEQYGRERTQGIFDTLIKLPPSGGQVSSLASFFAFIIKELGIPEFVIRIAHGCDRLDQTLLALAEAENLMAVESKGDKAKLANIYILQGWAEALRDRGNEGHRKAFEKWMQVLKTDSSPSWMSDEATSAAASYHYAQLKSSGSQHVHVAKIKEIYELSKLKTKAILAAAYMVTNQPDLARLAMRSIVEDALELLNDDDPDNDWEGFYNLEHPLAACGDVDLALAALSLILPVSKTPDAPPPDPETQTAAQNDSAEGDLQGQNRENEDPKDQDPKDQDPKYQDPKDGPEASATEQEHLTAATDNLPTVPVMPPTPTSPNGPSPIVGPLDSKCDGDCGRTWTMPDDLWRCTVCSDIGFCSPCLQKLETDQLSRWVCHKSHSWYYVPPWSQAEIDRVPKGSVCIPRQTGPRDWSKEQGEIVEIPTLITRIKERWGIE